MLLNVSSMSTLIMNRDFALLVGDAINLLFSLEILVAISQMSHITQVLKLNNFK